MHGIQGDSMYLSKLIDAKDPVLIRGNKEKEILGLRTDSKEVRPKDLFIAISSQRQHIDEAILSGAVAVVVDIFNPFLPKEITQIEHPSPRNYAGILANRFYQNPTQNLKLFGVTGTCGKTTTTWMIRHLLGEKICGVLGTLGAWTEDHCVEIPLTTPEPVTICRILHEMAKVGLKFCAMECSSHGLDQNRVGHLQFEAAVFLNLSHDHLDYHKTMEAYYQSKRKLFEYESKNCVFFLDDPYGKRLFEEFQKKGTTFGTDPKATFRMEDVSVSMTKSFCTLVHQGEKHRLEVPMIGGYNLYNMVAAIAAVYPYVCDISLLCQRAKTFPQVPGRSELIKTDRGFHVMVDYAHKPDALEKLLQSVKEAGFRKITTVFGCGGERDSEKRAKMASIAERYSNKVIVTNDNPRKEDPHKIIEMICSGFSSDSYRVVIDRKEAIRLALKEAEEGELVVIAGRGHEKELKLRTGSIPFLDSEVAKNLLVEI
jgi:UDP-N-acetylmuramoyl-L-alanyl-D-glutamate--2,6-diaminopimelate ligase